MTKPHSTKERTVSQSITWKCMPNCLKCRIEAALKTLTDSVCEGCVSDGKEPHDQSICDRVSQTGNDGVNESFPE